MYSPKHYSQSEVPLLHRFMAEHAFVTLVSAQDGLPTATHLPVLLDPDRGDHGTLVAHMARANPQWRGFDRDREVLAIFHGPHGYVSPAWYEEVPNVPTWNYAVVHAYGTPTLLEPAALASILQRLTETYEAPFERPWTLELSEPWTRGLLGAIVGFEGRISRLEGKFKLNQNKTPEDRQRVVDALERGGLPGDLALAALMRDTVLGVPRRSDG
jgi:transcriptional regulator